MKEDGWYFQEENTHLFFKFESGDLVKVLNIGIKPNDTHEGKVGLWPTLSELEAGKPLLHIQERRTFFSEITTYYLKNPFLLDQQDAKLMFYLSLKGKILQGNEDDIYELAI